MSPNSNETSSSPQQMCKSKSESKSTIISASQSSSQAISSPSLAISTFKSNSKILKIVIYNKYLRYCNFKSLGGLSSNLLAVKLCILIFILNNY